MSTDLFTDRTELIVDGVVRHVRAFVDTVPPLSTISADLGVWADGLIKGGSIPFAVYSLQLAVIAVILVILPFAVSQIAGRLFRSPPGREPILSAAARDLIGFAAVLIGGFSAQAAWFSSASVRDLVARAVLLAIINWHTVLLLARLILRPRSPDHRLVTLDATQAQQCYRGVAWLSGLACASFGTLRAWLGSGLPRPDVQVLALILGAATTLVAFFVIRTVRHTAPVRQSGAQEPYRRGGRLIVPAVSIATLMLFLAWALGVTADDLTIFWCMLSTLGAICIAWLIRTLAMRALQERASLGASRTDRIIVRCLAVALALGTVAICAELWIAALSRGASDTLLHRHAGQVITAVLVVYVAFVGSQILFLWIDRHLLASDHADGDPGIATRLQTMLPVLRILLLVIIVTMTLLTALSALGVNTTSLLAGTSIVGLAISFGSQSLVHDIVSGAFYMGDDAFRIGEYIDVGKLKGTVEGMSIRSLKLRHQNGQVHTIPFGQIHQVSNFSRDWQTVKFNLQLAHGADIGAIRKAVKQIGAEMAADPELGPQIIEPLKLQGIDNIDTNGVVIRLKFKASPLQPTTIYRDALRRVYEAFQAQDIQFATNSTYQVTLTSDASRAAQSISEASAAKQV